MKPNYLTIESSLKKESNIASASFFDQFLAAAF